MSRTSCQLSTLVVMLGYALTVATLYFGREVLVPIALAALLSFVLAPVVDWWERRRVPRSVAVLSVSLFSLMLVSGLVLLIASQLVGLSDQLPRYKENLIAKVRTIRGNTSGKLRAAKEALQEIGKEIEGAAATAGDPTTSNPQGAASETTDTDSRAGEGGESSALPKRPGGTGIQPDAAAPDVASVEDLIPVPHGLPPQDEVALVDEHMLPQEPDRDPLPSWDWSWMQIDPRLFGSTASPSDAPGREKAEQRKAVDVRVVELPPSPLSQVQNWLGALAAPLSTVGLVFVLTIFMLLKRDDLRDRIVYLFGVQNLSAANDAMQEVTRRLGSYLRTQVFINALYGIAVAVGLALVGLPNALLWGTTGFLFRFLPYIGPWVAAVLPIALSLAITDGWSVPVTVIAMFVVYELIVNNVLEPWLYGSSAGVSIFGVIVAVVFWTWLWGPMGLLLAMPLTVCMIVMSKYIPQMHFIAVMLGDQTVMSPPERLYQYMLWGDVDRVDRFLDCYVQEKLNRPGDSPRCSRIELLDELVVPALMLAERDRHANLLSEGQEAQLHIAAQDVMDWLDEDFADGRRSAGEKASRDEEGTWEDKASQESSPEQGGRIERVDAEQSTCPPSVVGRGPGHHPSKQTPIPAHQLDAVLVPGNDFADEVLAEMIASAAADASVKVEAISLDMLASELVERVDKLAPRAVVLVTIPPAGQRDARHWCKRLRRSYHCELPILVLYPDTQLSDKTRQRLVTAGATRVDSTVTAVLQQLRQLPLVPRSTHADTVDELPHGASSGVGDEAAESPMVAGSTTPS
ncbi:MAG: hypothetical protein KatS3mg111_3787 [Pirellulaceae bacterium]|nr:MAG: hypothetical protein KatS3mg111_3787 [Pirellulaceae bacterium]